MTLNVRGAPRDFFFKTKNVLNFQRKSTFGVIPSTICSSALNVRMGFSGAIQIQPALEFQQPQLSLIVIIIWQMMRLNACIVPTAILLLRHHKYAILD